MTTATPPANYERRSFLRTALSPQRLLLYFVLVIIALFFILPLIWMLSTSLKFGTQATVDRGWIPAQPSLQNFTTILQAGGQTPVARWFMNSTIVATVGTTLAVLLTSLSAYAFARIDFRFKGVLFGILIATLLLPSVMFLVPQFMLVRDLRNMGVINTQMALFLPGVAGVFGVFFMRQFFLSIPVEIEEAAYVDGAGRLRTFFQVVLPLARPALATLAVITFLAYWNDYLWPLVIARGPEQTLTAGLRQFQTQFTVNYGLLMAGAVIAAVPVLIIYALAQRWIVQAVTSSGVKG
ncbi:MAG TPA: carbohydrate ABC transporter permease [Candidatus Limnocylindrales bacterium]|nr:carbohydrate ABC transporter permease [Candidatus Limnocylindrales bacterium]